MSKKRISILRLSTLSFLFSPFLSKIRSISDESNASNGMVHNGERITKYYIGALKIQKKKKKQSNKSQLMDNRLIVQFSCKILHFLYRNGKSIKICAMFVLFLYQEKTCSILLLLSLLLSSRRKFVKTDDPPRNFRNEKRKSVQFARVGAHCAIIGSIATLE